MKPKTRELSASQLREIADEKAAQTWWSQDGLYIDPDTDDVDWHTKRRELAQIAFLAGVRYGRENFFGPAPSEQAAKERRQ